jgi:hypothetical protein
MPFILPSGLSVTLPYCLSTLFERALNGSTSSMFVFKAAVAGGGTMAGEIAQVIANAEIP